jgi:type II secretory ATPase GspE/PulE/Tfp pilus assembly ATPase PilB-like protein
MERTGPDIVTVGGVDGQTKVGRVARFSPRDADITLEVGAGAGGRPARVVVHAERAAWVGIHRRGDRAAPARPGGERVLRRVHVGGGKSYQVRVLESAVTSRLGFWATPDERGARFEEMFFYAHGVNAVEDVVLLGALLVADGAISAADLERGTAAQVVAQSTPIGQILLEQQKVDPAGLEQAVALQERRKVRLGELLVEEGLVSAADVDAALVEQKQRAGKRLGQVLVEMNLVTEERLTRTLAKKFGLPFVDLDRAVLNPEAAREVSRDLIARYGILPVDVDAHMLTVALSDPLAMEAIDQLRFHSNRRVREVLVAPGQLKIAVARHLEAEDAAAEAGQVDKILLELAAEPEVVKEDDGLETAEVQDSDSAVIKLAQQIILDAYRDGASDIHIEPNGRERSTMVRFRVDGECVAYKEIPPAYRRSLVSRLKIMAQLDIAERRKPQDGKIRLQVQQRTIELRVATIPTTQGNEDVVLRILAAQRPVPLERMGFSAANLATLRGIIKKPYGLVLCVGPTGSGKTTTLHSVLASLNQVDTKIWTAEDPVEITQAGLRQVQVNPRIGFTFAAALRAFLRADPDVIMVGEMRDQETAQIAVEASLTGHLVLSTLHTNSAPETITRLLDMGLDPFSFSDALLGVVAQRLARTLCRTCRERYEGTPAERAELTALLGAASLDAAVAAAGAGFQLYRPRGCGACAGSGYQGRMALHEILASDDRSRALVARRAPVDELRQAAREAGMRTLLEDGVDKALAGTCDLRQVLAVAAR